MLACISDRMNVQLLVNDAAPVENTVSRASSATRRAPATAYSRRISLSVRAAKASAVSQPVSAGRTK